MFNLYITYQFGFEIVTRSTGVTYVDMEACKAAAISAMHDLFMISAGCLPV